MYIYNYSSEPNRKKIFSYVVLFFVALCFSNPFYLLPHFYVRYMHSYFRKAVCVILDVMLYEFIMNVCTFSPLYVKPLYGLLLF